MCGADRPGNAERTLLAMTMHLLVYSAALTHLYIYTTQYIIWTLTHAHF